MAEPRPGAAPPRVPFVISVGVTGHRAEVLGESNLTVLGQRIRDALRLIAEASQALFERERACFAADRPLFRFVSPIADGADQVAAEAALELGWELQVITPFAREAYRSSLANHGARERFDSLLERAACVLELPGESGSRARRLCHGRPGDGGPLRHADGDLGRPPPARPRRHRRSGPAGHDSRHRGAPHPARRRGARRGYCGARSIRRC